MTRLLLVALAIALYALPGGAQQPQPFTASSDLIVVPAIVTDKKGELIGGLTQADFKIFEDGKSVPVETFVAPKPGAAGTENGRFIVLVLDNLTTKVELGFRVKDIANRFADRMRPADVITVLKLSGGRTSSTNGKAAVKAEIARFTTSMGQSDHTPAQDAAQGLKAISDLTSQMSRVSHPRKVLVFIGSASMFSPREESAFFDRGSNLSSNWFEAIRDTGRNNVSVYAIDPKGQSDDHGDWGKSFASETGGDAWVNTNNFDGAVDRIWQESGRYYLLGYSPPINDHRIHKIEVKVRTPGVTVRARRARG